MAGPIVALLIWLAIIAVPSLWGAHLNLVGAMAIFLAVTAAAACGGIYMSSVRRAHALAVLKRPVWWQFLLDGHFLRSLAAVAVGAWAGVSAVVFVITLGPWAVLWVVATAALMWALVLGFNRMLYANIRTFVRLSSAMRAAALATALVMAVIWTVTYGGSAGRPVEAAARYLGPNALLGELTDLVAIRTLSGDYVSQWLPGWVVIGIAFPGAVLSFGGLALAAAGAGLMGLPERRRMLAPSTDDIPLPVPGGRLALWSAMTFILAWISVGLAAGLEAGLARPPEFSGTVVGMGGPESVAAAPGFRTFADSPDIPRLLPLLPRPSDIRHSVEVAVIGDRVCPAEVLARARKANATFAAAFNDARDQVKAGVHLVFDQMRANVPVTLDWYYSLSAEYLRTANLLVGNGEDYLRDKLHAGLEAGVDHAALSQAVAALSALDHESDLAAQAAALLDCKSDLPSDNETWVVTERMAKLPPSDAVAESRALKIRLGASGIAGGAGAVATFMGAKLMGKVVVSSAFKLGAKALVKVAGTKALSLGGGVVAGGVAGGAGGSVVPGLGTGAGAVVGGIVGGIAVMVGVDFMALKLEEMLDREEFGTDLLASIDAAEAEALKALGLD